MTYFPLYLWLRTLLLYSFFKKLTWFINMYLTHHFRNWSLIYLTFTQTTIFILCVIPSASYITSPSLKIKIWNQCMQNESWLWKDCEVINGFSKKYTYDLDWKFSILKKVCCHIPCSVNIRCYKKSDYQNPKWICTLQQLLR